MQRKGAIGILPVFYLEKNASPSIQDGNDAIPLHLAIRAGHKQIVRLLLECDPSTCNFKENARNEPLYIAAVFGHADIVQNLLDCGATTLAPSGDETALHIAARKGHHDICDILLKHDKGLTRSLWERMTGPSLQVHAKDYPANTPFAYAVEKGHERAVDVFLRHYPELGKTCNGHKNLLFHRAIEMRKVEMVRIFLSHGTGRGDERQFWAEGASQGGWHGEYRADSAYTSVWPCH